LSYVRGRACGEGVTATTRSTFPTRGAPRGWRDLWDEPLDHEWLGEEARQWDAWRAQIAAAWQADEAPMLTIVDGQKHATPAA
jgi:hypothetical protein